MRKTFKIKIDTVWDDEIRNIGLDSIGVSISAKTDNDIPLSSEMSVALLAAIVATAKEAGGEKDRLKELLSEGIDILWRDFDIGGEEDPSEKATELFSCFAGHTDGGPRA